MAAARAASVTRCMLQPQASDTQDSIVVIFGPPSTFLLIFERCSYSREVGHRILSWALHSVQQSVTSRRNGVELQPSSRHCRHASLDSSPPPDACPRCWVLTATAQAATWPLPTELACTLNNTQPTDSCPARGSDTCRCVEWQNCVTPCSVAMENVRMKSRFLRSSWMLFF